MLPMPALAMGLAAAAGADAVLRGRARARRRVVRAPGPARAAAGAVAIAGAAIVVGLPWRRHVLRLDEAVATFAAGHARRGTVRAMRRITKLGATKEVIVMAATTTLIESARGRGGRAAAFLTVAIGGQSALSNLTKLAIRRTRPDILRLTTSDGASFPSGHTTAAAASLASIAMLLSDGRGPVAERVARDLAVGLAAMVGTTRVLLGVHWTTDVVGGLVLGWGWFAVVDALLTTAAERSA